FNVQLRQNGFSYDIYQIEKEGQRDEGTEEQGNNYPASSPEVSGSPLRSDIRHPASSPEVSGSPLRSDIQHPASSINFHRIDINFEGANPDCEIVAEDPSSDYLNYYTATTPESGITNVRHYGKVTYRNLYPGIDLEYMADEALPFKYNFIVKPGADMEQIRLKIDGASDIFMEDGSLVLINSINPIRERIPVSFLQQENGQTDIQVTFHQIEDNVYGFSTSREIPSDATLIIDPIPDLVWGTFYGGSSDDILYGCTVDVHGNLYGAGNTESVNNIASGGSFQSTLAGASDAIVIKFNAAGVRQWGTYYGGAYEDYGFGVAMDTLGNCFVAGSSNSTSGIATPGTHQTALAGSYDGFLVKFDASGFRIWGTYYGGNWGDFLFYIVTDSAGNCFLTGGTSSTTGIATPGAYKTVFSGLLDVFVAKFNSSGVIQWGTYYGGSSYDEAYQVSINGKGDVFIGGETYSVNGIATAGTHQQVQGGNGDAFLANFDVAGNLQWGTYYGGLTWDIGHGVFAGDNGSVYLVGQTTSFNGISSPGSHQPFMSGVVDAFFAKLDSSGTREWGTYYGGINWEVGFAVKGNSDGNVYFTGNTSSPTGISTPGVYQPVLAGNLDVFLTEFNPSGDRIWGTYYGGPTIDYPRDLSLFGYGHIYVVGATMSSTGISTPGSHQPFFGGMEDGFIAKFSDCLPFNISSPPSDLIKCAGENADFQITTTGNVVTYQWQVNPGSGFTNLSNSAPYSGVFTDHLVITGVSTGLTGFTYRCVVSGNCPPDLNSTAALLTVNPSPTPTITGSGDECEGNSGVTYTTEAGMTGYTWTVTAGGTITAGTGTNAIMVTWNTVGAQTVTVNYFNSIGCAAAAATVKNVNVNALPVPTITGSGTECNGSSGVIYSTESGMTSYTWTVSAGGTITAGTGTNTITVTWNASGAQAVTINYTNTNGCTAATPTVKNVTVNPLPAPTISPQPLMTESFENGGAIPADWALEVLAPNNTITFPITTSYPSGYSAYNGTYLVRFNSYDNGNGVIRLKRATSVSTVGYTNVIVNFAWLESSSYPISNDRVEVEWSPDGTTWYSAGTFLRYNTIQGWKIKTQALPAGAGGQPTLYIAFKFTSEFGNDCYLDLAKVYLDNSSVCAGGSALYQTESGMTAYGWTLSSGGIITSGSGTSSISASWPTPGPKTVSVNYTNSNGCKANIPTVTNTTVLPLPVPTISGPAVVCEHDTSLYRTQKNMTSYVWNISSGGTINGSATDSLISVTWDTASSGGNRWIEVTYTNSIGCIGTTPTP
ncbi:MAG: SBBP repeat-containing protein, partial [Bacteroidetes bacterium]|nr:SBBP repeat-containing protein [Bacteroidota bacterium]